VSGVVRVSPRGAGSLRERLRGMLQRGMAIAERRLPALTRLRRVEPLPVLLDRRRIYVLPTRSGLFFGALIAVMLLGALNYNNNPALLLCFVIGSALHTSLLHGYLTLRGVRLVQVQGSPVYAGSTMRLRFTFEAGERRLRRALCLQRGDIQACFTIAPAELAEVDIDLRSERRGWLSIGRVQVYTRHPLGLFHIWSWVHPERRVLVYPAPEASAPPLPRSGEAGARRNRRGQGDEPHSLREYRVGDPLRLVAWKRSARTGHLMVREFETPAGGDVQLDWERVGELPYEERIRRLTRWLIDAEREGLRTHLRVPGSELGPASGSDHLHACLRALALLPRQNA